MTVKNSVEHIFPRNQKEENKHLGFVDTEEEVKVNIEFNLANEFDEVQKYPFKDDFGNLVQIPVILTTQFQFKVSTQFQFKMTM